MEVQDPLASPLGCCSRTSVLSTVQNKMASQELPEIITILDNVEEEDDWPESGPVNLQEAKKYMDCINDVFDTMAEMLHSDKNDALPKCIRTFKKLIVKDWHSMTDTDPEVVIRLIYNPACIYLCQHIARVELTLWSLMKIHPVARILLGNCWRKDRNKKSWSLFLGYLTVPVMPTHILLWLLLILAPWLK